uniref:Uncharacterized protein n=1 Tax=Arundo donax TaxID=35708 RepID=A0A0A9E2Z9_ARUDO
MIGTNSKEHYYQIILPSKYPPCNLIYLC